MFLITHVDVASHCAIAVFLCGMLLPENSLAQHWCRAARPLFQCVVNRRELLCRVFFFFKPTNLCVFVDVGVTLSQLQFLCSAFSTPFSKWPHSS